jgi:hypothetical protein
VHESEGNEKELARKKESKKESKKERKSLKASSETITEETSDTLDNPLNHSITDYPLLRTQTNFFLFFVCVEPLNSNYYTVCLKKKKKNEINHFPPSVNLFSFIKCNHNNRNNRNRNNLKIQ